MEVVVYCTTGAINYISYCKIMFYININFPSKIKEKQGLRPAFIL